MEKQQDGYWTVTTPQLVPGFHYSTLIIDGMEVSDLNTHAFFGGTRSECCDIASLTMSAQSSSI